MTFDVDEWDEIFFVAHGKGFSIRTPRDVDVFAFSVDCGDTLGRTVVPDPHRPVSGSSSQQVWVGRVPDQLVNGVTVAPDIKQLYYFSFNK